MEMKSQLSTIKQQYFLLGLAIRSGIPIEFKRNNKNSKNIKIIQINFK